MYAKAAPHSPFKRWTLLHKHLSDALCKSGHIPPDAARGISLTAFDANRSVLLFLRVLVPGSAAQGPTETYTIAAPALFVQEPFTCGHNLQELPGLYKCVPLSQQASSSLVLSFQHFVVYRSRFVHRHYFSTTGMDPKIIWKNVTLTNRTDFTLLIVKIDPPQNLAEPGEMLVIEEPEEHQLPGQPAPAATAVVSCDPTMSVTISGQIINFARGATTLAIGAMVSLATDQHLEAKFDKTAAKLNDREGGIPTWQDLNSGIRVASKF
ncbi:hypothetical protein B0H12DRAFT_1303528 [Mycena haematopus]|nr:hypothetical protein B0H12DRAFT_1303528 [Mycena haematopus]